MAWPTASTATTGTTIPVSDHNELFADMQAINSFVRKTADESITSSATLQNDDHLLFSIPAAGTYIADAYLIGVSAANAAGDMNWAFTFPAGTAYGWELGPDNGLASGTIQTAEWKAGALTSGAALGNGIGLSTIEVTIWIRILLIATASGTLQFQWAQRSSNGSASTLKAGSHMTMRQVA